MKFLHPHQTLVKKSDGSLWVLNPIKDYYDKIGDEYGNIESIVPDNINFIYDEFGVLQTGCPGARYKHPITGKFYHIPDLSLRKYLNMSPEKKEDMRQQYLEETVEHFENMLMVLLDNNENAPNDNCIYIDYRQDYVYRFNFMTEWFIKRADRVFDIGYLADRYNQKIFVFNNVPFLQSKDRFVKLDRLNPQGVVSLAKFLVDSKYQPHPKGNEICSNDSKP